jgi:hypothetical protein
MSNGICLLCLLLYAFSVLVGYDGISLAIILKVCFGEHGNCSWVMILFLLLLLSDLCLWLFLCISRVSGVLVKQ